MSDQPHNAAVATEDVTYGWAPGRLFAGQLAMGWIAVIIVTGLFLLVDLAAGTLRPDNGWLVTFLVPYGLTYPVAFAGFALLFTHRRPPWLQISATGVELAASRTDPVFIPWSAVSSARFRWWWPLTLLEITVSDSAAVVMQQRGGRRPKRRYRAGRESFIMDVGALRAKPKAIRTELARRGGPLL